MEGTKPGVLAGPEAGAETPAEAPAESAEVTHLVEEAQAGDAEAFSSLMLMYEGRIIALGRQMGLGREDAMDACQDAFVKVFKYIGRFQNGKSFYKWLYRIAIHAIYDQMRGLRPHHSVALETLDEAENRPLGARRPTPDERLEAERLARRVRESLDCLTQRERIVFVLRDLQEMSTEEIGTILRLSQITVRRHCMSARQKLRRRLFPRNA